MRYLTKGELLGVLGDESDAFTAFMLNPAQFGVTDQLLSQMAVVKQKFDWTGGVDLDFPDIQQLVAAMTGYGVLTQAAKDALDAVADNPLLDNFNVRVIALDDVTVANQYGLEFRGDHYRMTVEFLNTTKGTMHSEDFVFQAQPDESAVTRLIAEKVKQLRMDRQ